MDNDWEVFWVPDHWAQTWFTGDSDSDHAFRIFGRRLYVERADSMTQGSALLQPHLNDISAIVVDFKISPNGSKLLRIVHDNGVLLVYIPHDSVEANHVAPGNAIKTIFEGYNVWKVGEGILQTFRLLEEHFEIFPMKSLELVPYAQQKRPNLYPSNAEVGLEDIVTIENGRVLPSDPVGQAIDSLSWSTSRASALHIFEISEAFHSLTAGEYRKRGWGAPPIKPIINIRGEVYPLEPSYYSWLQ